MGEVKKSALSVSAATSRCNGFLPPGAMRGGRRVRLSSLPALPTTPLPVVKVSRTASDVGAHPGRIKASQRSPLAPSTEAPPPVDEQRNTESAESRETCRECSRSRGGSSGGGIPKKVPAAGKRATSGRKRTAGGRGGSPSTKQAASQDPRRPAQPGAQPQGIFLGGRDLRFGFGGS